MPKKSWALRWAGPPLGLLAFALSALAGAAAGSGAPFIVDSWTAENGPGKGPPDNEIISVIQTHDGYLWLGTLHGLVRFDGIHFTVFNENNTPGLASDQIAHLFEDRQTNLWVGTESSGLFSIHDGKVKRLDLGRADPDAKLTSACEDATGAVWFYTADSQLIRYQGGKVETLSFNFPTPPICRIITIDISGALWIADVRGMYSIRPENFNPRAIVVGESVPAERLDYIQAGRDGGIWRFMNGQVQKWTSGRVEKDFHAYPWGNSIVKAACEDKDGNLIVGTLGDGVYWYQADGQYWHISTDQGLSSAYVLSLCLDREGNLWVGTDGNGLDRIKRKTFDTPFELHPWAAQSLSADNHGGLWMAFNARGVAYWTSNSIHDFAIGQASNAWTVLVDKEQRVWAGTRNEGVFQGLFQFRDGRFQPAPGAANLGPNIFALFESRDGRLWAGTQRGLGSFDGQKWNVLTTGDGLSDNTVRAIAEDASSNLWAGTESRGLNLFKDGKFTTIRAEAGGLPGDDISCLYAETNGVLWVGTSGHGLARLENGKWARYATTNGLVSDSINYITEDAGCLWIGSNEGLLRIPKPALNDFAAGATNLISCRTYGKADGLPTRECSAGSQPAAIRTDDGRLWFPTTKGVATLDPAQLKPQRQPPVVMIESIIVDRREQKTNQLLSTWPPAIIIPPGGEELEIHYTALNFSAPELVRFKCWLEGHETSWPEASDEQRGARYPKLPPGRYTFHVKASNADDVWSGDDAAVLTVIVQPQFWQTGWFRGAAIVFILGIVAAIARYLSTQKLQRQLQSLQQREALEKERARIARDLHDQLGANLTQVALLGEMAEADKDAPAEIESHAQQISQTARETTRSLDEIVWAVNPANDTLDGLVNYAGKYAQEYLALAGLRCRADLPAHLPAIPIPPEVRHNVFLAFKEAVHNVVKHAQATEARIRLRLEPERFILEIEDNGRGLPNLDAKSNRNGLRNMKKRMEDIHGDFSISDGANGGTIVRLTVPIK